MRTRIFNAENIPRSRAILTVLLVGLFISHPAAANDLAITDVSLARPDRVAGTAAVRFSVSWQNSWRNRINRDAVWFFIKYSIDGGSSWRHATLAGEGEDPPGFSSGISQQSLRITVPRDRRGSFLERARHGHGEVRSEGVELIWDWREDGLLPADEALIRVYGIEMVYIPRGGFFAGDGDGEASSPNAFYSPDAANLPVLVGTDPVSITAAGNIHDDIDVLPVEVTGPRGIRGNEDFPTGYGAFYIMKYEITEGDWVAFFNTLNGEARHHRDITGLDGKGASEVVDRNTVTVEDGYASTQRPHRAMSYLSWPDLCAFAEWAALRPMTELEFEKAARGNAGPSAPGEYAWGTLDIVPADGISGDEDGTETVFTPDANAAYGDVELDGGDGGRGPLRVGIFAASGEAGRIPSGASYYGVMELSGNVRERCVTIGVSEGRAFKGSHGRGELSEVRGYEGAATRSDWPGYVEGRGVTAAEGSGFRGGSWLDTDTARLAISCRSEASVPSEARLADSGGRAVRTAP